jgi:hypothetical protein
LSLCGIVIPPSPPPPHPVASPTAPVSASTARTGALRITSPERRRSTFRLYRRVPMACDRDRLGGTRRIRPAGAGQRCATPRDTAA